MNPLDQYLKKLDSSTVDGSDSDKINKEFQELISRLKELGLQDLIRIAELDRMAFSVNKSFDYKANATNGTIAGLSWKFSGTETLNDGSVVPFYWPDVQKFTREQFEYYEKRYKECKSLYTKTEYGLLVYFGKKTAFAKNQSFFKKLSDQLFKLALYYKEQADLGGLKNYSNIYFTNTLKLCFYLTLNNKLEHEFGKIVDYLFNLHQNWDVAQNPKTNIISLITHLFTSNYKEVSKLIDFKSIIEKNSLYAKIYERTDPWISIHLMNLNIKIAQKVKIANTEYLFDKARYYELLMVKAKEASNMTAVTLAKNALDLYKLVHDGESIKRLSTEFKNLRGKFKLMSFKQELPESFTERINMIIDQTIIESSTNEILHHFIITPWYETDELIRKRADELASVSVIQSLIPAMIVDKFGNTIEIFSDELEKKEHNFWNSFGYNFQIGTQTMCKFFIKALMAEKLNFESTLEYLNSTWFAQPIRRSYHGQELEIYPIDTLISPLKRFFEEFEHYKVDNTYPVDFIMTIECLTLRVEGLIRYFCEKAGIPTFKTRQRSSDNIMMEKLLDDFLLDLKFSEDELSKPSLYKDHWNLIKYVMTAKSGWNIRNMVAHSLLDINEYTFEKAVVLFCIILKLSSY